MALNFKEESNIFPHSREFETGGGKERPGQATVVVSLDGTGDTDDIQEAIDMLPPTGGMVFIKEGTYVLNSTISITQDSVVIIGTGTGTIISQQTNIAIFTITGNNIILRDFKLLGMSHSGGAPNSSNIGFSTNQSEKSIFENLWFEDMGGVGISLGINGIKIVVSNCNFINGEAAAVDGFDMNDSRIINNYIKDVKGISMSGIKLNTISATGCDNNVIMGNIIDTTTFDGIYIANYGTRNIIVGNSCTGCSRYGIEEAGANSDKNIITNNACWANSTGQIAVVGAATINANNIIT